MHNLSRSIRSRFEAQTTLRRFTRLATWSLVSFALEKVAAVLVIFLLARILGAADYGRLMLAQGLVNTLQIFTILGAGTILSRFIPEMLEVGVQRAVQVVNLCGAVVLTAGIFILAIGMMHGPAIAGRVLDLPPESYIPYCMLAWVVLSAATNFLLSVMIAFERGHVIGMIASLGATLSVTIVPLLADRLGVGGAVAGLVTVELLKAASLLLAYTHFVRASGARVLTPFPRSDMILLLSFGLPTFLTSALWGPTMWIAQLIVKALTPDGLVVVGVFAFTNNIFGAVVVISSLTNRAAFPIMSSLAARSAHKALRRMTWLMAAAQAGAAAVIGFPLALAAPVIMAEAGPEFAAAWPVLLIMIATGVIWAGQTVLGNHLLVLGKPYFMLGTMATWTATVLASVTIFTNAGAYSLAWGLLAGASLRAIILISAFVLFAPRAGMQESHD